MLEIEFGVRADMSPRHEFIQWMEVMVGEVADTETSKYDKIVCETETGLVLTLRGSFNLGIEGDVYSVELHDAVHRLIVSVDNLRDCTLESIFDDKDDVDMHDVFEELDDGAAILGSRFDDVLLGGSDADLLNGADGDDRLDGMGGADRLRGGRGDDTYVIDGASEIDRAMPDPGRDIVESGQDYVLGPYQEILVLTGTGDRDGRGNAHGNTLYGNSGRNLLEGQGGDDVLDGRAGADRLVGGDGDDRLVGGSGTDMLAGGRGDDRYLLIHPAEIDRPAPDPGTDTIWSRVSYVLGRHQENLTLLGTADLEGRGNAAGNVLIGNDGRNTLSGSGGDDRLRGGAGSDTLAGNDGADALAGGDGADALSGGRRGDVLTGATGADLLDGRTGADDLRGGGGADMLDGGAGADGLRGGGGTDTLDGGPGNDLLVGGSDSDAFLFDDPLTPDNIDLIADFRGATSGEPDFIVLDHVVFPALPVGALPGTAFRSGAGLTGADTPECRIFLDTTTGALYYDADGSGAVSAPVQFAVLAPEAALPAGADFIVV